MTLAWLSACSSARSIAADTQAGGLLNENYEDALAVELQLAIGTLKLDGTDNAVDAGTAKELLTFWKALHSLSGSESAADEEIQAVIKQIQEAMTTARIQAIATMQLTRDDMVQVAQEMGINLNPAGGRFEGLAPELQATVQAARERGQMTQGGFRGAEGIPGGAGQGSGFSGGIPPGGDLSPEQLTTAQARRASGAGINLAVSPAVLEVVIQYLESKMQ